VKKRDREKERERRRKKKRKKERKKDRKIERKKERQKERKRGVKRRKSPFDIFIVLGMDFGHCCSEIRFGFSSPMNNKQQLGQSNKHA